MAIPGRHVSLSELDLQVAFADARRKGKEYVVTSVCRSSDGIWSPPGMGDLGGVPVINTREFAISAGGDSCAEDLRAIFTRRGASNGLYIKRVHVVETGETGGAELLPVDVDMLNEQFKWDAQPWYFRLFSSRPEAAPV